MRVKCRHKKKERSGEYAASTIFCIDSPPFYVNPRGILIHRVRAVCRHLRNGEVSHSSVTYWCGNQNCFHDESQLVSEPPKNRLLCSYCEAKAEAAGEVKADTIVGRHVHRGVLRAFKTCCIDEN